MKLSIKRGGRTSKKGTIEQLNLHVDETKWLTSFILFFLKKAENSNKNLRM